MAIVFKTIRYRHRLESREISEKIAAGELTEVDDTKFVMGMVKEWDFKDEETGDPIPAGEFLELSLVQHAEVMAAWDSYVAENRDVVKKTRLGK